jgi:hypothetical protein
MHRIRLPGPPKRVPHAEYDFTRCQMPSVPTDEDIPLPLLSESSSHSTNRPRCPAMIRQQMPQIIMQFHDTRYQLAMEIGKLWHFGMIANANANAVDAVDAGLFINIS